MIEVFHWSLRFKDINKKKKKKYCWLAFSEEDGEGEKEGDSGYQQVYLFFFFLFAAFALLPLRLMGVFLRNHITSVYELRILNKTMLFCVLKSQFLTKCKAKTICLWRFHYETQLCSVEITGTNGTFFFFFWCVCVNFWREIILFYFPLNWLICVVVWADLYLFGQIFSSTTKIGVEFYF